jgi:hypothetical protein
VQLRLKNEAGRGDWSDPLRVATPASAAADEVDLLDRLDVSAGAVDGGAVRITVTPRCPFLGPLELAYYRRGNGSSPEEVRSFDGADRDLDEVLLGGFAAGTSVEVCVGTYRP